MRWKFKGDRSSSVEGGKGERWRKGGSDEGGKRGEMEGEEYIEGGDGGGRKGKRWSGEGGSGGERASERATKQRWRGRVECNHNERHSVHDTMLISQSARTGKLELREHF